MIVWVLLLALCLVSGKVVTFVDDRCGPACSDWLQIVSDVEDKRPDIAFEVVRVSDSDFSKYVDFFSVGRGTFQIALPKTLWVSSWKVEEFGREMTGKHLLRWVDDAMEGHFDLVRKVSTLSEVRQLEKSGCFVEYLGPTKPKALSDTAVLYPSVQFMWLQTGVEDAKMEIRGNNVSFVKCLDSVSVRENSDLSDLRFRLYPAVVTTSMLASLDLNWSDELHIVSANVLPVGWDAFARVHASTLFVHLDPASTEECPGVWYYRGAYVYHYPSLGAGVQSWFDSVLNGSAVPLRVSRESGLPEIVLGDNELEDWASMSDDVYVCACEPELCRFSGRCVAHMSDLTSGRMYHFENGTKVSDEACVEVEL